MNNFQNLNFPKNGDIKLKSAQKADIQKLAKKVFQKDNLAEIAKFANIAINQTDARSCTLHLKGYIDNMKAGNKILLIIFYKDQIAGRIAVHEFNFKSKLAELGYFLFKEFRGLGIMAEAIRVLEGFLFETVNINRIELCIDPDNLASLSLAKKAGYIYEGTLRQSYYNDYLAALRDDQIWSKLKS